MASKYTYPAQYLRWFIEGDKLGLVTIDYLDTSSTSVNNFNKIDESLDDGLLIYYEGGVPKIDVADKDVQKEELEINARCHSAVIDYILSRLYAQKKEMNEADIISANRHYTAWRRRIAITNGGKLNYGGQKVSIPEPITSLR